MFFRDPVQRALSQFHFMRWDRVGEFYRDPGLPIEPHDRATTLATLAACRRLSLSEFVSQEPELAQEYLGNHHVWVLSEGGTQVRDMGPDHLKQAIDRLPELFHIGLCERIEESLAGLTTRLGWPTIPVGPRWNATPQGNQRPSPDPQTQAQLETLCSLDRELYRVAQLSFRSRELCRTQGSGYPLPNGEDYHPGMGILGGGWHRREKTRQGWLVWSGPQTHSWLCLRATRPTDSILELDLDHHTLGSWWNRCQVSLNGTPLVPEKTRALATTRRYFWVSAETLGRQPGVVHLEFQVRRTVRPWLGWKGDPRHLGIGLKRVRLLPRC